MHRSRSRGAQAASNHGGAQAVVPKLQEEEEAADPLRLHPGGEEIPPSPSIDEDLLFQCKVDKSGVPSLTRRRRKRVQADESRSTAAGLRMTNAFIIRPTRYCLIISPSVQLQATLGTIKCIRLHSAAMT